jgi:hypothetical protein
MSFFQEVMFVNVFMHDRAVARACCIDVNGVPASQQAHNLVENEGF